jgi:hypothetical protein
LPAIIVSTVDVLEAAMLMTVNNTRNITVIRIIRAPFSFFKMAMGFMGYLGPFLCCDRRRQVVDRFMMVDPGQGAASR